MTIDGTCKLLRRRHSWSAEFAETMLAWLVLFLMAQATTSWARDASSFSANCNNRNVD